MSIKWPPPKEREAEEKSEVLIFFRNMNSYWCSHWYHLSPASTDVQLCVHCFAFFFLLFANHSRAHVADDNQRSRRRLCRAGCCVLCLTFFFFFCFSSLFSLPIHSFQCAAAAVLKLWYVCALDAAAAARLLTTFDAARQSINTNQASLPQLPH